MQTEWSQLFDQVRRLFDYHVPTDALPPVFASAMVVLAAGVVVAVLGARLARPAMAVVFGLGGAIAAGRLAMDMDWPVAVNVIVGGILVGGTGFLLYRLWVAIVAGAFLLVLSLGVVAYQRALPELQSYQDSEMRINASDGAGFALLAPDEQARYVREDAAEWAKGFWSHVTARHAGVERNLAMIGGVAALLGLFVGAVATRFTLILGTSLAGTAFVAAALALLAHNLTPDAYRAALSNPPWVIGGVGAFLLSSLVLQARLNRKPRRTTPDTLPA